uniref:Uncharacterized LOC109520473 n=1 Tax=Hippocampus comes TaxID=109280 RepID=A0A3Q2YQ05_HIPCM
MSNTPIQEKPIQAGSPASGPLQPSRSVQPMSDPSVPKRLCFYKSGDHTFGGHRVVINARTFKTFDALLDALSKKVPLPFGVRTITTPRGTHLVKGLDDLQDGGSYLCSDQKRVKPVNLEEVNRRQVPWNMPRAFSVGRRRRQFGSLGRADDSGGRPVKVAERVVVRTPKRLVVIKNKDPDVRRTIVLQKRTAPTFDALLDYLSQILQFPVLKLYSIDGRRVSLAGLILCSGFLVAAGNEPFRLSNNSFQRTNQTVQAIGRCSRNFSSSSEQYIINQINKSRKGSANSHTRSPEFHPTCMETCRSATAAGQRNAGLLPQDDDIEKSFRVNQDGSMTVEMKVRLTIKEEEMLHWTTTVSRSSLRRRTLGASVAESGNISPDSNIYVAKGSSHLCEDEAKKANQPPASEAKVCFNNVGEARKRFRCASTPGSHRVMKEASFETVKMLTESGVQGSTLGHYSYLERTTEGDTMEGYCRVRHSSSSSQPVPKPRKTILKGNTTSLLKSSGVAEVLKIENDGTEVRETVMRIYERQGKTEEKTETKEIEDYCQTPSDTLRVTASCLSVPLTAKEETPINVSMAKVEPTHQQTCVWSKNSSESNNESPSSQINILSPKAKLKPVLQELCSSIQSIQMTSDQSSSPLDFSYHVASVFGSSCKSVLSFLSVMALRDSLTSDSTDSMNDSEAMLLLKFLQNISAIEDQDEQRASLIDLHSGASPQFMKCWMDFQTWRENLETQSLIPKFQDTQESIWVQGVIVDQLMKEFNMPYDLRREISSALQQAPAEECDVLEPDKNYLESADLEQVVQDPDLKQFCDNVCIHESTNDKDDLSSWPGGMEEEHAKETGCESKEPNVSLGDTGKIQVREENIKGAEDHMEESKEALDEGETEQKGSEEDTEEEAVLKEEGEEEELGKEGTKNKESEEKSKVVEEAGNKKIDERQEARQDGAETDLSKSNEENVDEEVDKEGEEDNIEEEKNDKDDADENVEKEETEVLSFDNKEGNADMCELTPEKQQVCLEEQSEKLEENEESTRETNPEESVDQVEMVGGIKDETESDYNLECYQKPNPVVEVTANELDEGLKAVANDKEDDDNIEENMEAEGTEVLNEDSNENDHVDIPESLMEWDLVKQTKKLEEESRDICAEEESLDEVAGHTPHEVDIEDSLGWSLEPNPEVEGIANVPSEGKDDDNVEKNMEEEGTEVLNEDKNKKGNNGADVHDPTTDEGQVDIIEQREVLEMDREDTRETTPEEESQEKVEEPIRTPSETGSEDDLGCSKEQNTEVEGKASLPNEGSEKVDYNKEDYMEDEGRDTDGYEKGNDNDVDIPEPTTDEEKIDEIELLEKREKNEKDTRETSPKKVFVDQVEMPDRPRVEAESEDDLGCSLKANTEVEDTESPHDEGIEEIEDVGEKGDDSEDEKDQDEIEENMQTEGTDILSEMNNEEGILAIPEPAMDMKQVNLNEQTGKLEEEEEGTYPKEESGEKVEEPNGTPTETKSENGLRFQEPNPEVKGSLSAPSEGVEEVVNEKDVAVEDEDQEKDDIEDNMEGERTEVLSEDNNIKGYGDDAVVPEPTADAEQENLTEQIEKLDEEDTCPEKESGEEDLTASVPDETLGTNPQNESVEKENLNMDHGTESPLEYLSDERFVENKARENKAGIHPQDRSNTLSHPVEISQELLDFVNSALQSSSLIFTYDDHGNIRIEPDRAQITEIKTTLHPAIQRDCTYGSKCLQSPITSDLSDYRPESFESGPYQSQDSEAITSENNENASESFPEGLTERTNPQSATSKILKSHSEGGSFSSSDSLTKGSRKVLSCCKKGDNDPSSLTEQNPEPGNGILIDQGRWLLKENHLIRNSPPVSEGMYRDLDTTSEDMGNSSEESQTHKIRQHTLLGAISSSDLEELAKPQPPRCSYFTMPHGSDSDPFPDDTSDQSRSKDTNCAKGRGFRVSPVTDTSKTLANKNCSLSSFASVEFKIADRKVYPEGEESTAGVEARGIPGDRHQSQDSADAINVRCGQYCQIL